MPSRRSILQRIGVGTGGLLVAGTVSGTTNGPGDGDISEGVSALITVDYEVDSTPDGFLPVSTETSDYPFSVGADGSVYLSEADSHPDVTVGSDVIVTDTYGYAASKAEGQDVTLSGDPRALRSGGDAFVGEIQSPLRLSVRDRSADGVPSATLAVAETSIPVEPGETVAVDEQVAIQYTDRTGTTNEYETTVSVTVEHRGERRFVAHPERRLVPADHRLAEQARLALQRQNQVGADRLDLGRDVVEVDFSSSYGTFLLDQQFVGNAGGGN